MGTRITNDRYLSVKQYLESMKKKKQMKSNFKIKFGHSALNIHYPEGGNYETKQDLKKAHSATSMRLLDSVATST